MPTPTLPHPLQQAMELWEYQVIHLNIEGPPGPQPAAPRQEPPPAAPPPPPAPRPEAVFSKEYLEKEFPGFYGANPAQETAQSKHPAYQLRNFLNLQGRDGWQLVGFFPVGQLVMMIFRRPLVEPAAAAPPGGAPAAAAVPAGPQESGALERILERLETLEGRLGGASGAAEPAATAGRTALPPVAEGPAWLALLRDGEILPAERNGDLDGHGRLSTAEAARALGFRSAASLLNLAAASGYPPGLIKRGANGRVAIYMGSEKNGRGGRDRRLWVVLGPGDI